MYIIPPLKYSMITQCICKTSPTRLQTSQKDLQIDFQKEGGMRSVIEIKNNIALAFARFLEHFLTIV